MAKDPRRRGASRHITSGFGAMEIDWASEKQRQFFVHPPTPICASGGFGSAKTYAACLKVLWLCETFPGNRGLIARKVWEDLKNTTMKTFFKICKPDFYNQGGRRSDTEKYLRLNNGSEILWAHMDDPETENVIKGIEINFFFIDQAEEVQEGIWDLLMTRLGRWDQAEVPEWFLDQYGGIENWPNKNPVTGEAQVPNYAMLTCNPADLYHWIYRRFHPESEEHYEKKIPKLTEEGKEVTDENGDPIFLSYEDLGYKMLQMKSYENKFLPKHNLALMMQKDEAFRKRYVEGEWGITGGTIHTVDKLSIIDTDPNVRGEIYMPADQLIEWLRRTCTLHRTLDHGDSSPTSCIWWAVDKEGNVFAYREYYAPGKLVSEHRKTITELSEGEKYKFNLADPSIFHKTMQKHGGRWSVYDEYSDSRIGENTVLHWQPADNNEMGTRNRISEYLRVDPSRVHPLLKTKPAPRLFFVKASDHYPQGCRHLLRETRAQQREKIGEENGRPVFSDDRDESVPDHAYDGLRYLISSRPPVAVEPGKVLQPGSFEFERQRMLRSDRQKGKRMGYLARKLGEKRAAS